MQDSVGGQYGMEDPSNFDGAPEDFDEGFINFHSLSTGTTLTDAGNFSNATSIRLI